MPCQRLLPPVLPDANLAGAHDSAGPSEHRADRRGRATGRICVARLVGRQSCRSAASRVQDGPLPREACGARRSGGQPALTVMGCSIPTRRDGQHPTQTSPSGFSEAVGRSNQPLRVLRLQSSRSWLPGPGQELPLLSGCFPESYVKIAGAKPVSA
jgi:hypothetical protein